MLSCFLCYDSAMVKTFEVHQSVTLESVKEALEEASGLSRTNPGQIVSD